MWKLKSMGHCLLKMDIGHRWDVLKLTFWVSSDDGTILERLSGESLNGGQFTCTSRFFFKSKMLVAAQCNYPLTMSRDCFASFESIILTAFIKGNSFSPLSLSCQIRSKSYLWCIQSAGASEKGKEDRVITKTKVWEPLCLMVFLLTSMVLNLSSTNICV